MKWETIQLGEVIDIKHGYAFKSKDYSDAGDLVLLTPGNCHESGGLKLKGDREKYYVGEFPPEFLLEEGDMLVVMTDLINTAPILGGSFVIPERNRFLHNQRLGLVQVTDETRIDRSFLFYLLNTYDYRAQVRGSASGATVRHTSPGRIKACKVLVPREVDYQRKVGGILSVYDDLIENNRRRMALLEEAARHLYGEWFVRLRFPGHEHTRITNGVPEGWKRMSLGAAASNFDRLRVPLSVFEREARPGSYPYHGAAGILDHIDGYIFDGRYLLVGEDGTVKTQTGTPMLQLIEGKFWVSNHAHVLSGGIISTELLYCMLSFYPISGHVTGVAQPKLTQENLNRIPVLNPPRLLRDQFQDVVDAIFSQHFVLQGQNHKLRAARDLLLPRLMSGE